MKHIVLILVAISTLWSCNYPTTAKMEKVSPSGKVKLSIDGNRSTGVEPWKVSLKVKAYNFKEGELITEIYSKTLDDSNVSINWFEESSCDVVISQSDNTKRTFRLISNANQMQFAEIPSEES